MAAGDIDPDVELLPDIPISGAAEDLFERGRIARRLAELAIAGPVTAPRLVALTGEAGSGKTSVLRMLTSQLGTQAGLAVLAIDAAGLATASAVASMLSNELTRLFEALGVVEASEKVRNTLSTYGGVVSSIAKLAGVKVDVAGALERSGESLRSELAQNLEQVGQRLVIVIDHLDRLPAGELALALSALRMYAAIPYASMVIAVDRRATLIRPAEVAGADPTAFERLVQVELALPPPDRLMLARVLAGALARLATRTGRDLDAVLPLVDPDGGLALELVHTPRDAKRAANALSAGLPLIEGAAELADAALEIVLRVLVPELDEARLASRARLADPRDRQALCGELCGRLAGHPRAAAARAALEALLLGGAAS